MLEQSINTIQVTAGWLLIASGLVFLPGGGLFAGRVILKWPAVQYPYFRYLERGLVMASFVTTILGLVLLDQRLRIAGDYILAPIGLAILIMATSLVLASETFALSQQVWNYAPIVAFVILSFIGQALFGVSLLSTGLVPGWAAWATILWNLGWLIFLPITRPRDIYFPWLHFVAPLLIGIELLLTR